MQMSRYNALLLVVASAITFLQTQQAVLADFSSTGEQAISLEGNWSFRIDPDNMAKEQRWYCPDHPTGDWDRLPVPGNWDTVNEYAHYVGQAVYRRTFETAQGWHAAPVRLHFGAVYQKAEVYLNGHYLGTHVGGYTPFEFPVGDMLVQSGENVVAVIVDNTYNRGAWWNWGGISRDVKLIRNNSVRVVRQKITTVPDIENNTAAVTVQAVVSNDGLKARQVELTWHIAADSQARLPWGPVSDMPSVRRRIVLQPFETRTEKMSVPLSGNQVKFWHFDTPYLYQSQLHLLQDDTTLHRVRDRFGIRDVRVQGTDLMLNGERIRANGFNRISDHRTWGNTEPLEFVKREADLLKSNGAVLTRLSHVPLAPDLLDYLDQIGMLIIQEIPVWGIGDPQVYQDNPLTRAWLREMILRDYNHPCIIGWSVGNEITIHDPRWRGQQQWSKRRFGAHQFAYVRSMFDYIRNDLDPTRLLTYVSYTVFREVATPANDPATLCDIILVNCYGDVNEQVTEVHRKWPDKPIFVAEIGKGQIGLDLNESVLHDSLFESMDILAKHDYIVGWSWWSFNDYRSRYRGTPVSENRAWGFYNVWRQPKRALNQVKPYHAPVRRLELMLDNSSAKADIVVVPRHREDIPSYTLRAHKLHWRVVRPDGTVCIEGSIAMEDLPPQADARRYTIDLQDAPHHALFAEVRLTTATGHVVHQTKTSFRAPETPQIRAVTASEDKIRVEFSPVPGADRYQIHYQRAEEEHSTELFHTHFYELNDVVADQVYEVSVVAVNDAGAGSLSTPQTVKTTGPKLSPVIWHAEVFPGGFMVGYSVDPLDEAYALEVTCLEDKTTTLIDTQTLKGAIAVRNLSPGRYQYRLRRQGQYGQSRWSLPREVVIRQ